MSVLAEICARKRTHVAARQTAVPLEQIIDLAAKAPTPLGFINILKNHTGTAIIAEVKKASPSKGIIRADFDPVAIAQIYKDHGAACLSVLTDEPYFQGHDDYFTAIRATVSLPLLRKDFMLDAYQIYESRAMGADCILLIMAALGDEQAAALYALSIKLGMDVLVEVHDAEELNRALKLKPAMIGVNNRNLKTLAVDIQTSHDLARNMPAGVLKVAESGIDSRAAIESLQTSGFEAFLIGESLMKQANIGKALATLLQK